jgi:hypothetical protein
MHTSGFVALAMVVLIIAVAILAYTMSGARHDTAQERPPPFTQRR